MNLDIAALGWDAAFATAYHPFDRPDHRPARVTRVDRAVYGLLATDGAARAGLGGALLAQVARDPLADLAQGAEVIAVSARRGTGLDRLRPLVARGRTLALLGPSGAGKSTLVNALAGTTVMVTQAIRRADGRGRHTTTQRALIPLPDGGAVLDTPGLRGVGLHDAADGLEQAFSDIDALAAACRFGDCRHEREPGCAVRGALANGDLSARRLASWRRLGQELTWQGRRATQVRQRYEHRRPAGRPRP